jgi:hypothetical protein
MDLIFVLIALFVVVRLISRHSEKRAREREELARKEEAARRRRESEERSRYVESVLDAEARRLEVLSTISSADLSTIRAGYPDHVDQFMLVRWGWSPCVIADLDPPEIVVTCGNDRKVSLYARQRLETMEADALDRSADYVDRLCYAAEEAETERQVRLAAEDEERARCKRVEEQLVIDITGLRKTNDGQ